MEMDQMDVEHPRGKEKTLTELLRKPIPVNVEERGIGLPYAPVNWPEPGDLWGWKVGRRISDSGYFKDRYIYPPKRLLHSSHPSVFRSKPTVTDFIKFRYPNANIDEFSSSFTCWPIPAKNSVSSQSTDSALSIVAYNGGEMTVAENCVDVPCCKSGNRSCASLLVMLSVSEASSSEQGFCKHCCCTICCKLVTSEYGYIRCEASVDGSICGHIAHIRCFLRNPLPEAVIGVDEEYKCRVCGSTTDLVSHAEKLLRMSESVTCRESLDALLTAGVCILRGSDASQLLSRFSSALLKLRKGARPEDVWKEESKNESIPENGLVAQVTTRQKKTARKSVKYHTQSLIRAPNAESVQRDNRLTPTMNYEEHDSFLHTGKQVNISIPSSSAPCDKRLALTIPCKEHDNSNNKGKEVETYSPSSAPGNNRLALMIAPTSELGENRLALTMMPYEGNDNTPNISEPIAPENYDTFLNSIDELLYLPSPRVSTKENIAEMRVEISALLASEFSTLVASNKLQKLSQLSSKLIQSDPTLTPGEISMLNLIREVSLESNDFIEAEKLAKQADKFFSELNSKVAQTVPLRKDFNIKKELIEKAKAEGAVDALRREEIVNQIGSLQAQLEKLDESMEARNKVISEYTSDQKEVMTKMYKIASEVQVANVEKDEWELKKKRAAEKIQNVVAKFSPLQGFKF